MSDQSFNHTQQFQQAIDTTITCRSIVKYNSTLSDQQKAEILASIDTTLTFMEAGLAANATSEATSALLSQRSDDLFIPEALNDIERDEMVLDEQELEQRDLPLKNLYRIYHSYLSDARIADLETRYRIVMGVLEQLEEGAGQQHDTTSGDLTAERVLHRVRGFITTLYCMFREFAAVFSNIVEGKNIDMDTESLALLDQYSLSQHAEAPLILRDITPLIRIYATHLQLQGRKGVFTRCSGDAVAFLVFLEGALEPNFVRRNEVITQLKAIAGLLSDLTRLLAEYEQAMSTLAEA